MLTCLAISSANISPQSPPFFIKIGGIRWLCLYHSNSIDSFFRGKSFKHIQYPYPIRRGCIFQWWESCGNHSYFHTSQLPSTLQEGRSSSSFVLLFRCLVSSSSGDNYAVAHFRWQSFVVQQSFVAFPPTVRFFELSTDTRKTLRMSNKISTGCIEPDWDASGGHLFALSASELKCWRRASVIDMASRCCRCSGCCNIRPALAALRPSFPRPFSVIWMSARYRTALAAIRRLRSRFRRPNELAPKLLTSDNRSRFFSTSLSHFCSAASVYLVWWLHHGLCLVFMDVPEFVSFFVETENQFSSIRWPPSQFYHLEIICFTSTCGVSSPFFPNSVRLVDACLVL